MRNLHLLTEKAAKIQMVNESKIQRKISSLKKTMIKEQNLKLEAFHRADDLQTTVYGLEDDLKALVTSRPSSSLVKIKRFNPLFQRSTTSLNQESNNNNNQLLSNSRPKSVD